MSPRRCFFMPLLRTGDLLFNAVVLQQRLVDRTSIHEALESVRGSICGGTRDLFGHNVTEIGNNLLGDPSHADQLLNQHTLFGVFRHALSEPMVGRWGEDLKAGRYRSSIRALGATSSQIGALSAPFLRSCSLCVEADKDLLGFATWKLTHQISAVDRCPEHGEPLELECRPLGGPRSGIWPLYLPGEKRDSRAIPASLPPSDGYAAYLRLWHRVLTEDLPWLKPSAWIQSMLAAVSSLGGIDAATDAIEEDIRRAWGVNLMEISGALSLAGRTNAVREELTLCSRPKDIARRMLLHGSLDRLGLDLFDCTEGDQRALLLSGAAGDRPQAVPRVVSDRLLQMADQFGLPLASIKLAELDSGFTDVAEVIGSNPVTLRSFAATLEARMLQDLMKSHQFSSASWVAREMARRRTLNWSAFVQVTRAAPP